MTKTLTETQITTARARSKLGIGVHWRRVDAEAHLGYRKGKRSGIWFVRWRNHYDGANYKQAAVGTANDVNDKVMEGKLTFEQAVTQARDLVSRFRTEAAAQAAGPAPTVRTAIETYIWERNARDSRRAGREIRSDAGHRLRRYVLGQGERGSQGAVEAASLAAVVLHALQVADLLIWRENLPVELKATTKQRLINDLKASLNAAWPRLSAEQKKLNPAFPSIIKDGFKAERIDDDDEVSVARDNQILTDAQVSKLLRAACEIDGEQGFEGDLYRLVACLAATGAIRASKTDARRRYSGKRASPDGQVPTRAVAATVGPSRFQWARTSLRYCCKEFWIAPKRRYYLSAGAMIRKPVALFGEGQNVVRGRQENSLGRGVLSASAQDYQKPFPTRCDIPASSAACETDSLFSTLLNCTILP